MAKRKTDGEFPALDQLERLLAQEREKLRFRRALRGTIHGMVTIGMAMYLVARIWLPVLQVKDDSMAPTLNRGDLVAAVKIWKYATGDIVAYDYNNELLFRRVVAVSGSWVEIDGDGTVYVDGQALDGLCAAEQGVYALPYQVPEGRYFVLGDDRTESVDSTGCISGKAIKGRLLLRVWPLDGLHWFS